MYFLGVGLNDKIIYGGSDMHFLDPIYPKPHVTRFQFFDETEEKSSTTLFENSLFFEESFDPVSRIRRGMVYEFHSQIRQKTNTPRCNASFYLSEIYLYQRRPLSGLNDREKAQSNLILLGCDGHQTIWEIISAESHISGAVLLTLKSYRSLGEIPELNKVKIPDRLLCRLKEYLEKVEGTINRLAAPEVVDSCRDAIGFIIGELIEQPQKDLALALDIYEKGDGREKKMIINAARIVQRLHSRRKPNAKVKHQTRPLSEDDGQLAVRCLGFILKELRWAG